MTTLKKLQNKTLTVMNDQELIKNNFLKTLRVNLCYSSLYANEVNSSPINGSLTSPRIVDSFAFGSFVHSVYIKMCIIFMWFIIKYFKSNFN